MPTYQSNQEARSKKKTKKQPDALMGHSAAALFANNNAKKKKIETTEKPNNKKSTKPKAPATKAHHVKHDSFVLKHFTAELFISDNPKKKKQQDRALQVNVESMQELLTSNNSIPVSSKPTHVKHDSFVLKHCPASLFRGNANAAKA